MLFHERELDLAKRDVASTQLRGFVTLISNILAYLRDRKLSLEVVYKMGRFYTVPVKEDTVHILCGF